MIEFFEGVDGVTGLRVAIAYSATSHIKRVEEMPVRQNQPEAVTIRSEDGSHTILGSYEEAMSILSGPTDAGIVMPPVEELPQSVRVSQRSSAREQRAVINKAIAHKKRK